MRQLLLVLLFSVPALAQPASFKAAHLTTHGISMATALNSADCSATAIGPHALLTASHCELGTDKVTVDNAVATIDRILRDGNDHTILLLKEVTFTKYAHVSNKEPEPGDDVFIWGNPGDYTDLFRKGMMVGHYFSKDNKRTELIFDLNGFYGDSGSGVFDMSGDVVAVLSSKRVQTEDENRFNLMAALPILFTDKDYKTARDFK